MRLVKIQANQLQAGMFVAELDRPWLETPFALQGFMVRDDEEILYICLHVDYVYVDVEYTGSKLYLPGHPGKAKPAKPAGAASKRLAIKADFQQARTSFESASQSLDRVFNSLKGGANQNAEPVDLQLVRDSVQPLIDGVFRNKEAMAALVRLKEACDYRYQHGISMAVWGAILGRHIGLPRDEMEKLVVGCAMCDVGMTRLPDKIISQPQSLNDYQRQLVQLHTNIGAQMVSETGDGDLDVLSIIEHHHERFNGSGYPVGLAGSDIPLLARIAGLVDAYDAMITPRPYAQELSSYDAIQELIHAKGELFQDALVEQFVQAIGLFPTGSLVEFNTGEVGIVVSQNEMRRLKPEVVIVLGENKTKLSQLLLVDLSECTLDEPQRWIIHGLKAGSYGVNSEEYFI